jgi:hypothetical protein
MHFVTISPSNICFNNGSCRLSCNNNNNNNIFNDFNQRTGTDGITAAANAAINTNHRTHIGVAFRRLYSSCRLSSGNSDISDTKQGRYNASAGTITRHNRYRSSSANSAKGITVTIGCKKVKRRCNHTRQPSTPRTITSAIGITPVNI